MTSQDSKRLRNIRRAQEKKALKKALKKASREQSTLTSPTAESSTANPMPVSLSIPTVTEDDLLAFQISHFGDYSKPDNWFIDAELALNVPKIQHETGDLGSYPDGTKRTLTDEQIAIFRHTEIHKLLAPLREEGLSTEDSSASPAGTGTRDDGETQKRKKHKNKKKKKAKVPAGARRQRDEEIPYEERNKRKWEQYIEEDDEVRGALTRRRLARELDDQRSESVELDYG